MAPVTVVRRWERRSKPKPNGKGKKKRGNIRSQAPQVLAQVAMRAPSKNFGTKKPKGNGIKALLQCLDARIPRTLGLPRAVGPYTIIRTTRLFNSAANMIIFCPLRDQDGKWYKACGVVSNSVVAAVNAANNARVIGMPMDNLGDACECVPASLTVQVMNPSSLQTADGVFAMTRANQQMDLGTTSETWNEVTSRVISFMSPRLLTGGKLSLRGVQCNAYPLDMTGYSSFERLADVTDFAQRTWDETLKPDALSPIVFLNNNLSPPSVSFMVTMEWRVRFDPGHPAVSSHVHHDTLADSAWNAVTKFSATMLHAVHELAEPAGEALAGALVARAFA